ncbi:MAG: hypothetical protein JWP99_1396 [Devosia sp.]|nr:hypothetical protein [Devosia sp.]
MAAVSSYPGQDMSAQDVLNLAENYRTCALYLLAVPQQKSKPCEPGRLLVIHAIELYLNAYLLAQGTEAAAIRGMQHDLAKRGALVQQAGMVLRARTAEHLRTLSERREYVVSRYDVHDKGNLSQRNRLQATMEEVRNRVMRTVIQQAALVRRPSQIRPHSHSMVPGGLLVTS